MMQCYLGLTLYSTQKLVRSTLSSAQNYITFTPNMIQVNIRILNKIQRRIMIYA